MAYARAVDDVIHKVQTRGIRGIERNHHSAPLRQRSQQFFRLRLQIRNLAGILPKKNKKDQSGRAKGQNMNDARLQASQHAKRENAGDQTYAPGKRAEWPVVLRDYNAIGKEKHSSHRYDVKPRRQAYPRPERRVLSAQPRINRQEQEAHKEGPFCQGSISNRENHLIDAIDGPVESRPLNDEMMGELGPSRDNDEQGRQKRSCFPPAWQILGRQDVEEAPERKKTS